MPGSEPSQPSAAPVPTDVPPWLQDVLAGSRALKGWVEGVYARFTPLVGPSETKFLVGLSIVIGLFTGVFAYFFDTLIRWVFVFGLGPPEALADLPLLSRWRVLVFPALGGLAVGPLVERFCPESKGHGVPEVMHAVHLQGGRIRGRVAAIKAVASSLTIGTGGSAGREGPIIQIGASIGSTLGQLFRLSPVTLKTMTAAGSAAGIAAAFNAPLGGMAFALEIILGEITAAPFAMVVLSTVIAASVARGLHGAHAFFRVPPYRLVESWELLLYLLLGALCGILAKLFVHLLTAMEDQFEGWKRVPPMWQPAVGGFLVGAIGLFVPGSLGTGYGAIDAALRGGLAGGMLALLLGAKLMTTSLTLASGGSGGIFMPSLFCGAMLGAGLGKLYGAVLPGIAGPGAYALVGMAAFVAGATHAPLTAILILFELTNDYAIILPVMIASVTAVLVARVMEPESIYTIKLTRRGIRLRRESEASPLATTPVSEVMTRRVLTVPSDFPIGKLGRHFNKTRRTGFPVVDAEGRLAGLITFEETQAAFSAEPPPSPELPVGRIMREAGKPLFPEEPVSEAARRMHAEGVDRLPVVSREDPRKIVGIVSKADFLGLYAKKIL